MYREVRDAARRLDEADQYLRAALLGGDTRLIGSEATRAQAVIVEVLDRLNSSVQDSQEHDVNPQFAQAAIAELNLAWVNAEKVGLGTSPEDMKGIVLDIKTNVDFARAYLRASLGDEEV